MGKKSKGQKTDSETKRQIVIGVVIALIVGIINQVPGVLYKIYSMPEAVSELRESVKSIETDINEIQIDIAELQTIHKIYNGDIAQNIPDTDEKEVKVLRADGILAEAIKSEAYGIDNPIALTSPQWSANETVAVGINGEEYTASELQGSRVILSYYEAGQEVYFAGELNENNQWDNECLVNVYADNVLVIATKALYNNGSRRSYEQLFPDGNEWVYSQRTDNESGNAGDTWRYVKASDIEQTVSFEAPDERELIDPALYIQSIITIMTSHYHGNTAAGAYNDNSGEAYCISFYDDGTARTIYKGKFTAGEFADVGADAKSWYITSWKSTQSDDKDVCYMYYQGRFENGTAIAVRKRTETETVEADISKEFADSIIENEPFKDEVIWNDDLFAKK